MDKEKLRYCTRCKQEKPISCFYKNSFWCKECQQIYVDSHKEEKQEYDKKLYQEFKIIYNKLKINGCAICGGYDWLDFHHSLPTDKKFSISKGYNRSNKVLSDELDKCVLLCRKCHIKVSIQDKQQEVTGYI